MKYDDGHEVYEWLAAPKGRKTVEFDELADTKRIPKHIEVKNSDLDDEEYDDEDYVPSSEVTDSTDISSDSDSS